MSPQSTSYPLPARVGPREVFDLAWPVIVSMLSYTLMSAVDVLFVARLGTTPLAAIGAAIPVMFLFRAYGIGLLRGVRVLVAQRTGAGDHESARRLGWQALWLSLGIGVVVVAAIPLAWGALGVLGTGGDVRRLAWQYLVIRMASAPTDLLLFGWSGWFQGRGDTQTPMKANVVANLSNIALDAVLVFGLGPVPRLGIAGAALATDLAGLIGLALIGYAFVRGEGRAVRRAPSRGLLRRAVGLGHPLGVQDVLDVGAFTVLIGILAAAGEADLAAHVVVIRIVGISFLPGYGLASAAGVLVGQAVGARRPDLAGQAVRSGLLLAVGVMAAFGVVFLTAPDALLGIFDAPPAVADVGRRLLVVAASFQLFDAVTTVLYQALAGAGDTRFAMRVSVVASWLVKLPVAWAFALPLGLGAVGAWMGFDAELALLAVVFAWRVRSGRWLLAAPVEVAPVPAGR